MKVKITSYEDKNKVFDLMRYITDRYSLVKDTKVVLNDDDTISVYLVVSDDIHIDFPATTTQTPEFGPNISDEEIPF